MEIIDPQENIFTVYSKSGCPNCLKAKQLLKEKNIIFTIVDCDEYLLENRDEFLEFIKNQANKEHKTFPMIFDGKQFIGGLSDTVNYIDKLLEFNEAF